MSKPGVWFTAFLVGTSAICHVEISHAQSQGDDQLRGAIALPTGPQTITQNPASNNVDGAFVTTPIPTAQEQRAQLIATRANQRNSSQQIQQRVSQQRAAASQAVGPIANPSDPNGSPRQNIRVDPVQTGITPATRNGTDDFAPTGFRLGTFDATATLEQAIGYSNNISGSVDGSSGGFSQTDVTFGLTSNWSRHQLQTNIVGSYRRPFDSDEIRSPALNANTTLRLDLIDGVTLTGAAFYNLSTQGFTSSTLAAGAVDNPLQASYGGSLELQRTDRKLQFSLRGSIEKDTFEDADLGGGGVQSQSDRNNTDYGITARVGYELSPALIPFVELGYTIREFDETVDRNGDRRDSEIVNLRGGIQFDLGEKLSGEIAAGVVTETFEDASLQDLDGFTLNGQLNWSPSRETQFGLTLGTQTNSSIVANENGSIIYNARLDFDRQISARMGINAFADYQTETNTDNNRTLQLGAGVEYWVNRFTALTADIEYQDFTSDAANSDFDEVSGRLGVRFQR